MLEGWTVISMLAAITTKIRLGTLVTGIIYRYPSVLAKIAATLAYQEDFAMHSTKVRSVKKSRISVESSRS